MATTISLNEEAYESLASLNRGNENFSGVVLSLADPVRDKMNGFGSWPETDLRDEADAFRDEFDCDFEERQDALSRR